MRRASPLLPSCPWLSPRTIDTILGSLRDARQSDPLDSRLDEKAGATVAKARQEVSLGLLLMDLSLSLSL